MAFEYNGAPHPGARNSLLPPIGGELLTQGRFSIVGTWHKVSARHLPAYLDEMCFRFNNRKNQFLFRDTLIKLIISPNLECKRLTAKVEDAA